MMRNTLALCCAASLLFPLAAPAADDPNVPMLFFGEASWYGEQFHGKKTANGETYDMHAMTAAHRTLPFGTLIKVTNLENDKNVTVRVNDRGPFVGNRVLDLSRAAATQIGLAGAGVGKVEVRVLKVGDGKRIADKPVNLKPADTKTRPADSKTKPADSKTKPADTRFDDNRTTDDPGTGKRFDEAKGDFVIQAGAFRARANAETLAREITARGFRAEARQSTDGLWRVLVGPYADREAAVADLDRLAVRGAYARPR